VSQFIRHYLLAFDKMTEAFWKIALGVLSAALPDSVRPSRGLSLREAAGEAVGVVPVCQDSIWAPLRAGASVTQPGDILSATEAIAGPLANGGRFFSSAYKFRHRRVDPGPAIAGE
jgi:hypothetical protein